MINNSIKSDQSSAGEQTRQALINTGLSLFGSKGFEATSTREIAAQAKANIASIAYHFGGKEGLRLACADKIIGLLKNIVGQNILSSEPEDDSEKSLQALENVLSALLGFLVARPEARNIVSFMLRELDNPGTVLDQVCDEFIFPAHSRFCQLLGIATGCDPDSNFIKLAVFTMVGQVIYFRIGHEVVRKKMAWEDAGPEQVKEILDVILQNLRSFVATNKVSSS